MTRRPIAALLAILLAATAVSAQGTTATLTGVVTDDTGGALPGATVTIRAIETDTTRVVPTDSSGRYRAPLLEPGEYEIVVELQGFQTTRRTGIKLSIGQNLTVDLKLAVGQLQDVVTVSAEAPVIDTTRSSIAAVVDSQQIRDLPLNGRDFTQLTLLQPGVLASPTTTRQVDRGMGTQVSIAGARPNQISFQLDGTDVNFQGNGAPGSAAGGQLGVETVREFQVLINNYSAEYGRSTGGIVTAVTRSGTNQLSGAAFEFLRDERLDARDFFDPADEPKPPLTRNQFGGYLGGPIVRDRTFFFASYEGLRQERGYTSVSRVPSRATRARADIHPAVRPFLELYPLPNGEESGASGLYSVEIVEPTRENYIVGKIDHTFSPSHSMSARYSWDKASVVVPMQLPLFSVDTNTKAQFLVGEHKWIVTPNLLNTVKVAWNRAYEATLNVDHVDVGPSLLFIPGTQFGSLQVTGLTTLGTDTNTPTYIDLKSLQIVQSLTWSRGAHSVKSGVNWTRWFNDQNSSFTYGGIYRFTSVDNFVRNRANTFEGQAPHSSTDRQWRQNLIGLFVQDDWSARPNLTINTGLRYEFITVPTEKQGRVAAMPDPSAPTTTTGIPLFKNPSLKNIAPRTGFNWDITGDGRNALQGGAGLFFEPILSNVYRAYGNRTPPFYETINPRNPPFPDPTPAGAGTPRLRLDLVEYNLKNPYRVQYNVTYQRQLWLQTVVTAGFIGARGYNQIRNIEWNQAVPQVLADGRYFFPPNSVRRNPVFESIRMRTTDGQSWYKGLILGASRRFANNLALQASYTLGKSEDLGSQSVGSGDFENSFQPAYGHDPMSNKGLSDFDIRHNFVFNYTWQLPSGGGGNGVRAALLGGWQLSGIVTLRSGVPFSPLVGFDRARALPRSGGGGQRPSLAPGASLNPVQGGHQQYFDPNAFVLPEPGFLGDVPRNTIIGPGFATWDSSLVKNFRLADRRRLQVRVEAFNLLNRANFGLPAATVFDASGRVPNAGEITTTVGTARQVQLGVKFEF
ncbi:MAG TPA: carboxypeptidase regulatory-like domain-containing protein [Vicinamibacterales bacterium]|nr:carboxypeptidase regulatory-like domain-containing protein [Vicinamibacterales bacterium]